MTSLDQPVFLFDGDCGVCQRAIDQIRDRVGPPVAFTAYQSVDLAAYGVTPTEVLVGPILVRTDGTHEIGPLGMAEVLRMARAPYRSVGALMLAPGIRHLLRRVGPVMYRNRGRLPGAGSSCAVPEAAHA